jgi:hypothetical protein
VPFDSEGLIEWLSAFTNQVMMNVKYDLGATDQRVVELVDEDYYLDGVVNLNAPDALLEGGVGDGPLWMFAGLDVDVMEGNIYYGTRAVDEDGELVEEAGDDFSDADVVCGFRPTYEVKLYSPNIDEGAPYGQRLARRRVKRAAITVQNAGGFSFLGRAFNTTANGTDPTLVTTTYRASGKGRYFDPVIDFEKNTPGPFRVIEIGGEITV